MVGFGWDVLTRLPLLIYCNKIRIHQFFLDSDFVVKSSKANYLGPPYIQNKCFFPINWFVFFSAENLTLGNVYHK